MRYLLASSSRRRFDIMAAAGMTMIVQLGAPPEEVTDSKHGAVEVTRINAVDKLRSAIASTNGRLPWDVAAIAADTLVHRGNSIYSKPDNADHALQMLTELRGTQHRVTTSVAMTFAPHRQRGELLTHSVTSTILMRDYSDDECERYLESGLWRERAGGYGVQDAQFHPTESVTGCYLNVVGLPLCAVLKMLPSGDHPFVNSHIYATCAAHLEQSTS